MRDSWYYSVPEGQIGPITLQELKDTLPNLPNAQDVYIWHDSLPEWIRPALAGSRTMYRTSTTPPSASTLTAVKRIPHLSSMVGLVGKLLAAAAVVA